MLSCACESIWAPSIITKKPLTLELSVEIAFFVISSMVGSGYWVVMATAAKRPSMRPEVLSRIPSAVSNTS
ncbi:MAG: hypothetical protein A2Z18_07235 [Armatimonadetes bacterium RBG_16_58_9]|nr:MAG: hypothetical protein A2Z18_07235 [Armatimonadetes bacterium RBG_16_58_9]